MPEVYCQTIALYHDIDQYAPHISLCARSSALSILSVFVCPPSSLPILIYAGIGSVIFPFGPVISTVEPCCVRLMPLLPERCGAACVTVKLTSGGSESGARPILERVGGVVEKPEVCVGEEKAGSRKEGMLVG